MRQELILHPDSRYGPVTGIEVNIDRPSAGKLVLRYMLAGVVQDLHLPPATSRGRADELWQHTCFEMFIRTASSPAYHEFNLSPSGQWAAYQFDGYRSGMRVVEEIDAPIIEVDANSEGLRLQASLGLDRMPDLPGDAVWHIGISAVIEEASGQKSYWGVGPSAWQGRLSSFRLLCNET